MSEIRTPIFPDFGCPEVGHLLYFEHIYWQNRIDSLEIGKQIFSNALECTVRLYVKWFFIESVPDKLSSHWTGLHSCLATSLSSSEKEGMILQKNLPILVSSFQYLST